MLDAERVDSALYFAGGQRGGRADRGVAPMELGV